MKYTPRRMNNIRFLRNSGSSESASDPGIASKLVRLPKILDQRPGSCHGRTLTFSLFYNQRSHSCFVLTCFVLKTGSAYIAQAGLELEVLLGSKRCATTHSSKTCLCFLEDHQDFMSI